MIFRRSIPFALLLALAGCSTPGPQPADAIRSELKQAAAKPAAPAPLDPAVSAALLPPPAALARELPRARQALEERFNVNLNNVPAAQFFNSLAAGTRYNMLVAPEVSGTISANLKDVTMVEALDAIRELYGYDYKIDGTRVYIRPLTMQTRMFKVNYLVGQRNGVSNVRVSSTSVGNANLNPQSGQQGTLNSGMQGGLGGIGQQAAQQDPNNPNNSIDPPRSFIQDSVNVNTYERADFWAELRRSLEALVGGSKDGRSVVVNAQSGVVLVKAMPAELRNVSEFLKATQLAVERQVILEAKIIEVQLNENFQSGINWASFASFSGNVKNRVSAGMISPNSNLAPLPFAGGQPAEISNGTISASTGFSLANKAIGGNALVGFAVQTANFAALLSFLDSQGTVHVLSSPRAAAVNNQKAVLKIGTDEFFVTRVQSTTNSTSTGNTTSPTVDLAPFFSGVVLDLTPQIDDQGNVLLHVHPSISEVTTVTKNLNLGTAGSLTLPLASSSTSEMDTVVRGRDGEVMVIGGLMRQAKTDGADKVPLAGDIPVIGNLFRAKTVQMQKRELVVLIKPSIVDGSTDWSSDLLDTSRRIEQMGRGAR
jgi:MSHA biogenesis protein MshL